MANTNSNSTNKAATNKATRARKAPANKAQKATAQQATATATGTVANKYVRSQYAQNQAAQIAGNKAAIAPTLLGGIGRNYSAGNTVTLGYVPAKVAPTVAAGVAAYNHCAAQAGSGNPVTLGAYMQAYAHAMACAVTGTPYHGQTLPAVNLSGKGQTYNGNYAALASALSNGGQVGTATLAQHAVTVRGHIWGYVKGTMVNKGFVKIAK